MKLKTLHTPGPWFVNLEGAIIAPTLEKVVANIEYLDVPEEHAANAQMMAASPEMFDALIYVRDMVESGQELGMSKILAAIKKAQP